MLSSKDTTTYTTKEDGIGVIISEKENGCFIVRPFPIRNDVLIIDAEMLRRVLAVRNIGKAIFVLLLVVAVISFFFTSFGNILSGSAPIFIINAALAVPLLQEMVLEKIISHEYSSINAEEAINFKDKKNNIYIYVLGFIGTIGYVVVSSYYGNYQNVISFLVMSIIFLICTVVSFVSKGRK